VNIDASLIVLHDGTTMTLTNGCVCCSIGGGFIETLGKILDDNIPFDHIIIEASGVGDPWRIAEIALVEPSLQLNAVIVLADASQIEALLTDSRVGDTVRNQFERADLVLLNKVDLLDRNAARTAHATVLALRNDLSIIETSEHKMPDLPIGTPKIVSRFRASEVLDMIDHERLFRRWSYQRNDAFDRARFETVLEQLPPQLLRLKGLCRFTGETGASLLQMVGQNWSLMPAAAGEISKQADILLVGIGTQDLPDTIELDVLLDRALASAADAPSIHATNDNGGLQPPTTPHHSLREGQVPCR
jgi:G3E family GTPase